MISCRHLLWTEDLSALYREAALLSSLAFRKSEATKVFIIQSLDCCGGIATISGMARLKNERHNQFLHEYFVCNFDGAKAYRRVYGNVKTAHVQAHKVLA